MEELSGPKRGLKKVTGEVGRVREKSPEKASLVRLVPRWRGHQGRCRALVSTILSFFNFAAKPCFNEDLGRCPVCKTVQSTTARVKTRVGGGGRGSNLSLLLLPLRPLGEEQFDRKLAR